MDSAWNDWDGAQGLCAELDRHHIALTLVDTAAEDAPLVYASSTFELLTGYSREEVIGYNCRFLQGDGTDPEKVAAVRAAVAERRNHTSVLLNFRSDGTPFYNMLVISPLICQQVPGLMLGCQFDFTMEVNMQRRAAAEKDHSHKREAAEVFDRMRDLGADLAKTRRTANSTKADVIALRARNYLLRTRHRTPIRQPLLSP